MKSIDLHVMVTGELLRIDFDLDEDSMTIGGRKPLSTEDPSELQEEYHGQPA